MATTLSAPKSAGCPFEPSQVKDAPTIKIIDHANVMAVLRDRMMAPLQAESGHRGQYFTQIVKNSVIDLYGEDHFQRRRILSPIFGPDTLVEIEKKAIIPGIIEPLQRLRDEWKGDGLPEADIVKIIRRTAIRMGALVIGIQDLTTDAEIDEFDKDFLVLERGGRSKFVDNPGPVVEAALAARERILAKYVKPVWESREELAAKVRAGDADRSILPHDLITAELLNPEHYAALPGSLEGEQALGFIAAVGSSLNGVCGVIFDLLNWFKEHPEDQDKVNDIAFLNRAQQESYRLHQTSDLYRTALYDAVLPSGIKVPKGTVVVIERTVANRALAEAGMSDHAPDQFDPYRTLGHGFNQQGFAFGVGVHTCIGRPLMMGDRVERNGISRAGFSSSIVRVMFAAGVQFDPVRPVVYDPEIVRRETFLSFPAQFTALADFEERLK
jgi:cytochrome P450